MRHRENRKAGTAFGGAIKWHPSIANVFGLVANLCAEKIPGFLRLSFQGMRLHMVHLSDFSAPRTRHSHEWTYIKEINSWSDILRAIVRTCDSLPRGVP